MHENLKEYFARVAPEIENAAQTIFPKNLAENVPTASVSGFSADVWQNAIAAPFYTLFSRGGKRLRPIISCLTYEALGGKSKSIYQSALIPELIHTGSLMIDDIEDNSPLRRGAPAVHTVFPQNITINAANFLYFWPALLVKDLALASEQKNVVYHAINESLTKLHLGQAQDLYWSHNERFDVAMPEYLQMTKYKTGALASLALIIGAALAGRTELEAPLNDLAETIGMLYQIQDDALNLDPDTAIGKKFGEDITEGKLTYFVVYTNTEGAPAQKARLRTLLTSRVDSKQAIHEAIAIMEAAGAFKKSQLLLDELAQKSKKSIQEIFSENEHRNLLLDLVDFIRERKK